MNSKTDTFLVCFDSATGDNPVLIVARKGKKKEIDIINAFKGDEARDLYMMLMDGKEKYDNGNLKGENNELHNCSRF